MLFNPFKFMDGNNLSEMIPLGRNGLLAVRSDFIASYGNL